MDASANKRLLCNALLAQNMPADMSQAPALMLARLMGHSAAVHWAEKKPIDKPSLTWTTFRKKELTKLGDVNGATAEIDRRWASLKTAVLKPTDLEISHDNFEELKLQSLSDGWKCVLEDKKANWYRKEVVDETPTFKAGKAAEKRMVCASTDDPQSKMANVQSKESSSDPDKHAPEEEEEV
eukprot:4097375-Prymnesium_polylepis.1